jgi:hypothetical protein
MMFAFSRDRVVPGHAYWAKVNKHHVPVYAVCCSAFAGIVITLPALWGSPLDLAFLIPIWLRLKAGSKFVPGQWTLGKNYKWMNLVAIIEILIVSFYFILPFEPSAVPGNKNFTWLAVNYAPILVGFILLSLWIWWHLSVKFWFNGPVKTI